MGTNELVGEDPALLDSLLNCLYTSTSFTCKRCTFWLRNGNFLRFKTLEIGYRLPYCRIYLSGDNLAVFSPFKLWDPELAWNAYPLSRTFNLGVQFTF